MWQQQLARALERIRDGLVRGWALARPKLWRAIVWFVAFLRGPVRHVLVILAQVVAALLVLFLEWGWRPLEAALARLHAYLVFARLEAWVQSLPPYGALALFAAPAVCLLPVKLVALYLFATGHAVLGVGLIAAAKVVGTAVVARIFVLTQPQLMRIGWFKSAYDIFVPWKERMFAEIRASAVWRNGRIVRVAVKRWLNQTWIALKPQRTWVRERVAVLKAEARALALRVMKAMGV